MTEKTSSEHNTPPPVSPPPMVRRREGRVVAGVAAAVAERLGVGTGLVRAGLVVLTLFGGAGVLLYVVGWLTIPEEDDSESIAAGWMRNVDRPSRGVGLALIVLGGLLVLGFRDVIRGDLVWATLLVLAGVLLYRGEVLVSTRSTRDGGPPPPPPPPPPPAGAAVSEFSASDSFAADEVRDAEADPDMTLPPPPPPGHRIEPEPGPRESQSRPRSILGRVTLALMLIAVGTMAILDNAGVWDPGARHYVGTVVAVTGVGLLIGAWFGRARALIVIGILLLPVLAVATVVRAPFSAEMGEREFRPGAVESVRDEYRLGAGKLTIDLRDVDPGDGVVSFDASVGAGQLIVLVDESAAVFVDGRVGFGEIDSLGTVKSGVGREVTTPIPVDATGYFDIEVEVGFGQIEVLRSRSFAGALDLPLTFADCGPVRSILCSLR